MASHCEMENCNNTNSYHQFELKRSDTLEVNVTCEDCEFFLYQS